MQQNNFNNNISRDKDPSINFRDCTCSLCPAHAQIQNKNGIYIILLIGNYICEKIFIIIGFSETYFKEIIRQLGYLKTQLWQTNGDIQDIKKNGIIGTLDPTDIPRNESLFYSFTLPLQTEDQLQEAETFLQSAANMTTTVLLFIFF